MRFKKLTEYWKKLTITLALPILVINSVMDYYYGWEARQQVIQEDYKLKWFILAHEHDEDGEVDWGDLREKGYGDMIPNPTDSFTPEAKVDSYLSRVFRPIKNTKDRFNNWWRGLYKEKQIKELRG